MYLTNIPIENLTIKRGDDFSRTFDIDVDGVILDLSSATVLSSINTKPDGSGYTIADFTVSVNGSDETTLTLTDVQTALITESTGFYDVLVVIAGDYTHYLTGQIDFVGTVTTGLLSSVVISAPTDGATESSPVTYSATVTTGTGRTITNVKFYANDVLLNTDTSAPYSYSWAAAAGTYELVATVTDDKSTYSSAAINITVS